MLAFIFVICCCTFVVVNSEGLDLPSYIPKCSLSDPNLNDCMRDNANKAIPVIAKGDIVFGLPTLSPVTYKEAPLQGDNLLIVLTDTYMDALKDFKVTSFMFDLPNKKIDMSGIFERVEITAQNYKIVSGEFIGVKAEGQGKFNMTLIKATINFKSEMFFYDKDGEEYMETMDRDVTTDVERVYYNFENLKSAEHGDMNPYIDTHWKEFRMQMKPMFDVYFKQLLAHPISVVLSSVPLKNLFLP